MRVLLVDDEPLTLESIEQYIKWDDLGIKEVKTASNGIDGLAKVHLFKPQIIISDVRMPRLNGIEFVTKIREFDPYVKIIFLSGYSDKEYLKSAINLKAVRYVEKPIKLEELSTAIQECIVQYRSESSGRNLARSITEQKWLTQLIKENKTVEEIQMEENFEPRLSFLNEHVQALAIRLTTKQEKVELRPAESTELIVQWLMNRGGDSSLSGYGEAFTLLTLIETDPSEDTQVQQAEKLMYDLNSVFGTDYYFTIGLGPIAINGIEIGKACRQAIETSKFQFYKGYGSILNCTVYENVCNDPVYTLDDSIFKAFRMALHQEQESEVVNTLVRATDDFSKKMDLDIQRVTNMYFRFLITLHDFAVDKGLSVTDTTQEERFIWKEISGLFTLEELHEYVGANIEAVFSQLKERTAVGARVTTICEYIHTHYADKGLTTRQIAENAYLSHTYLCALFKKETGKTLIEYLTEVRIGKAKELLLDRRKKLYEVALAIGITDSNYFSSLFKKSTGVTPSQYRERM